MSNEIIFEAHNIHKRFPGVHALKGVELRVRKGEVHALIGENGAGKSTLMKVMLGQYIPEDGEMQLNGKAYVPRAPGDALANGISMIHQEISLVPTTSVAENIWIGRENRFSRFGLVNKAAQRQATRDILAQLGLEWLKPDTEVSTLSIAMMQLVEVARAFSYDSDIIIMDEPTSALTNAEVDKLYGIIRDVTSRGKSVIFISHKLEEILTICDRVTVMRDGQYIAEVPAKDTNKEELVNLMVGRKLTDMFPKEQVDLGETVFEVKGLSGGIFKDVSFQVRSGEILGFSGLMGAGRTEIMQAIFGIDKRDVGIILIDGKPVDIQNTTDAIRHGLAMVTEDRLHTGAIYGLTVRGNIVLAYLRQITKRGFVNGKREKQDSDDMAKKLSVKAPSLESEISLLSGGNQQKAIIAKWLLTQPEVLILDEPTRGIDVGAKAEIYRLIGMLAKAGKAILMISSELPELMGICDRILVVHEGRIEAEYERRDFDQEAIMKSAFGVKYEQGGEQ